MTNFVAFDLGALPAAMFLVFFLMLGVAVVIFEIIMFIDIIKNKKLTDIEKILWALGFIFFHFIISVIYFFTAYSKRPNRR